MLRRRGGEARGGAGHEEDNLKKDDIIHQLAYHLGPAMRLRTQDTRHPCMLSSVPRHSRQSKPASDSHVQVPPCSYEHPALVSRVQACFSISHQHACLFRTGGQHADGQAAGGGEVRH